MGLGIGVGFYLNRFPKLLRLNERLTSFAIYLLLFLLGIAVGLNEQVINNLHSLGLQALIITIGSVSGSIFICWLLYRFIFRLK